jgi:hypothetical protein
MRLETRGPVEGTCNLCGTHARLTEDHVPPKGVPRVGQARLVEINDFLRGERATKTNRFFQCGVKYRSICARCNNELLGGRYDPELVAVTQAIDLALGKQLYLPIRLTVRPNRLARSVLGHLLAHGLDVPTEGEAFVDIRAFFNDESATLGPDYRLYCWLYPYNDQCVAQSLGRMTGMGAHFAVMSVIKFYPVGFALMKGEWSEEPGTLTRLDTLLSADIDANAEIELATSNLPKRRWPEAPDKDGLVMHTAGNRGAFRG